MRQAREKGKKHSYSYKAVEEVEVPACVAETATPVGEDMNLCGTDEFFARVALDIDKMLKSVEQFNLDWVYNNRNIVMRFFSTIGRNQMAKREEERVNVLDKYKLVNMNVN